MIRIIIRADDEGTNGVPEEFLAFAERRMRRLHRTAEISTEISGDISLVSAGSHDAEDQIRDEIEQAWCDFCNGVAATPRRLCAERMMMR